MSEATCSQCRYSKGDRCLRDGDYSQSYELTYTDSDFCGPNRRYFARRSMRQILCGE